jgi:uncharacterized protein with von Willebrand factor type A (vWA) domain
LTPRNAAEDEAESKGRTGDPLLRKLVQFSQFLRENRLEVTLAETLDAARSLLIIDMSDKGPFYHATRATLVKRSEDYAAFELLFERFWMGKTRAGSPAGRITPTAEEAKPSIKRVNLDQVGSQLRFKAQQPAIPGVNSPFRAEEENTTEQLLVVYSPTETIAKKRFRNLSAEGSPLLKRMLKKFARRGATLPGRRLVSSEAGEIDFRKTFRTSLGSGGQLIGLQRRRRKISKSNMVLFCDISGSMDSFSNQLLRLLYHACNTTRRTEVFAFSTRLVRLNRYLEGRSFRNASKAISENVSVWSSGTRIGSALGTLLAQYPGSLRSYTVFVIISDGWELDDLDILEANLRRVRRRVNRIIWLNPLADSLSYRPLSAGMKTALPYVDILAGLKIFTDQREFERVLGKSIAPLMQRVK